MSTPDDQHEPQTTAATPVGDEPSLVADRYRILRTLGRGGGGHVWLARDEKLGREVALKKVSGEADAEVLMNRGFREARTSATLAHEHVVRVYDAFEHEGSPWIVMEYVPGPSLASLIEGGRRLPVDQVATIGAQMATALAAAHSAGILHRDVKPANVLLRDAAGRDAKLTDFGIARAEEDQQLTRTGFVSGTAAYFSPELARGEEPSPASDVWALGATLYTALEGRRPFPDRPNAVAQLHTIVREQPRAPEHAGPLAPILRGMLDPDPLARWNADHAARELAAVARDGHGSTTWPAAGAGAAAGAGQGPWQDPRRAGADQHRWHEPGPDAHPTPHATQSLPVSPPTAPRSAPRTARPAPAEAAYHRPTAQRRPRRTSMWLGWLLVIPLLLALGWLVWTISEGVRPDGPANTSQEQTDGVGAGAAEDLAREFYRRLQDDGLDAARQLTTEDTYIDTGIVEGLTTVEVADLQVREEADGRAVVTSEVTYTYGQTQPTVIVQDETLWVARDGDGLRIVSRQALGRTGGPQR